MTTLLLIGLAACLGFSFGTVLGMFITSWFVRNYGDLQDETEEYDTIYDQSMQGAHIDTKA